MKTLKFDHEPAQQITSGRKITTWRLYDDKQLSVNDDFKIVDKVDPALSSSWQVIGRGTINKIVEKRFSDLSDEDMVGHLRFNSREEMLNHYRKRYGDRVTLETPVKIVHFSFEPGALNELSTTSNLESARLYTDGGSRGNPGPSAAAYVICNLDDNVVEKTGKYLGVITNNQAEYLGLVSGLERAKELMIPELKVFMDSELVINQMNGFYKVKNVDLAPYYKKATELAKSFEKITFSHVPRELNKTADSEVNRILDEYKKQNQ
jgi:ribonuclease HI